MSIWSRIKSGVGFNQVVDRTAFTGGYPFIELEDGSFQLMIQQTLLGDKETIAPEYLAFVQRAYKQSPIVFACVMNRMQLFSEARFQFRQRRKGRPGDLFGSPDLKILEKPWTNGTTGDLLAIAEAHNSMAGNFFCTRRGEKIRVMRPDWTSIILGSPNDDAVGPLDLDAEVIGYAYQEGGPAYGKDPVLLLPEDVAHWMQIPDPEAPFRGMSWITAAVNEILADKAMVSHKKKFLDAGATPNLAVKLNVSDTKEFDKWVDKYREEREGKGLDVNPYRTLFIAAAADPIPIGVDLKALDFGAVTAAGEVRIAAAAGVHPSVAAFTAGLQGSALNAGNFEASYRQFSNGTMRPNWRGIAGALETIVNVPENAELWYDDRDIPALQEDAQKLAETAAADAATINMLIMAGYKPDVAVDAVTSKDLSRLKGGHSGLPSVQLQPSTNGGSTSDPAPAPA